jgi:translation initiation factor 2 alpha subunit (eIF-2alpha)
MGMLYDTDKIARLEEKFKQLNVVTYAVPHQDFDKERCREEFREYLTPEETEEYELLTIKIIRAQDELLRLKGVEHDLIKKLNKVASERITRKVQLEKLIELDPKTNVERMEDVDTQVLQILINNLMEKQ